jgi:hypothetical protein
MVPASTAKIFTGAGPILNEYRHQSFATRR